MNYRRYLIRLAAVFALSWPVAAVAQVSGFDQVGTTSFQFLQVVPNARAAGVGGITSTLIKNSEAVFFNPAALISTRSIDASVSHLNYFLDVKLTSVSLAFNLPGVGTLGLLAQVTDLGDFQETRVDGLFRDPNTGIYNPGTTGETLSPSSMVVGLAFARSLTDRFSFGITAKLAREDLVAKSISSLMFDGGISYKTGFKSLEIGTTLRNFGPEVTYFSESYPLPQTFTMGVSGYLVGPGDAFLSPSSTHRVLLAYDLAQTRDHSQQQHVGVEYSLTEFVMLRSGYKFNFDEEGVTLGFGLKLKQFSVDYAYNDFGEFLGDVQRFTLNFIMN